MVFQCCGQTTQYQIVAFCGCPEQKSPRYQTGLKALDQQDIMIGKQQLAYEVTGTTPSNGKDPTVGRSPYMPCTPAGPTILPSAR